MNTIDTIDELSQKLVAKLRQKGLWLATAESCTGGLLAAAITSVAGSSNCFAYGIVSYSDHVKSHLLNVSPQILSEHTAVSKETALAMCQGLAQLSKADISISVTGVAGPGGGDEKNPVGTVYFGIAYNGNSNWYHYLFEGDRDAVRQQALREGLTKVLDII